MNPQMNVIHDLLLPQLYNGRPSLAATFVCYIYKTSLAVAASSNTSVAGGTLSNPIA